MELKTIFKTIVKTKNNTENKITGFFNDCKIYLICKDVNIKI